VHLAVPIDCIMYWVVYWNLPRDCDRDKKDNQILWRKSTKGYTVIS